ncbi:MAG: hypothetical protein PHY47_00675 [Lachnospiraceae bacterium]|nr:hypothetical protein [Lachnospiraceae bacterium]
MEKRNLYERIAELATSYESYRFQAFLMLHRVYRYKEMKKKLKGHYDPALEKEAANVRETLEGFEEKKKELRKEFVDLTIEIENLKSFKEDAEVRMAKVISIRKEIESYEKRVSSNLKEDE